MDEAAPAVLIRPPLAIRIYVLTFLAVWCFGIVWTTFVRGHGSQIVVGVVFLAFGVTICLGLFRMSVVSNGDSLRIVNNIRTRTVTRAEIEDFRMGRNGGGWLDQRSIQVLINDGTVLRLDVTRTGPFKMGTTRRERQLASLRAWLRSAN